MAIKRLMPFGKHKGTPLVDVPREYLEWLLTLRKLTKLFAADVYAVLHPDADLDAEVERLIVEHKEKYPEFDDDRFREFVRGSNKRSLRGLLAKGVAHVNRELRFRIAASRICRD